MPLAIIVFCFILEHLTRYVLRDVIVLSFNSGMALGFLENYPRLILVLSVIAYFMIIYFCTFEHNTKLFRAGLAFIAGGALSNTLERLAYGYVIDWIHFPSWLSLRYNIADIEIVSGVAILFLCVIFHK